MNKIKNTLRNEILNNSKFETSDVYPEYDGLLTRELISEEEFSFYDIDNVCIILNESEAVNKEKIEWYITLDFGCFEENERKQKKILEKIIEKENLIKDLIEFIKKESGLDLSVYKFNKPELTVPEEGVIEIVFS